jgi:hypothetical protein
MNHHGPSPGLITNILQFPKKLLHRECFQQYFADDVKEATGRAP